ncbi:hypothetical protein [Marinomonas colpomeniae]|uniref:Uncharacterized protein n=1 Tax=Marinomonas colpomeniae TaxID=2774408 RepID=A0ABR8P399_9GAMM|nr:hypothetical protein [Marinomonas colpomeniae]MBD5771262.1 hypothetical protein [Marinomonas colpomeniae]
MPKSEKVSLVENVDAELIKTDEVDLTKHAAKTLNSEMDQLRNIVFGSAKADLDARIYELQLEMQAGFQQAAEMLKHQMSEMHLALQESTSSLEDRIGQVDSHYDYKTSEIEKNADQLSETIELNNANGGQEVDGLNKRIDREVLDLTDTFTQKHDQTIDLLNQMKRELNSSKTDKKTLAKLLATVASNLEIEGDN